MSSVSSLVPPAGPVRRFLFLQGPHGPFFAALGRMLRAAGAEVTRVGFNRGDAAFWPDKSRFVPFREAASAWPDRCEALLVERGITDIVLYGDTRPVHAVAIAAGKRRGVRIHVFEEGYLRPYWVTYERDGVNGHSRLMGMDVSQMQAALSGAAPDSPAAPARWGDMRHHMLYGALYHFYVLALNQRYRAYRPHRDLSVGREFRLYLRRLLLMPAHWIDRALATHRVVNSGFPFHLVLLQLEHDANFRRHSPFSTMIDFLETVIAGFAAGAPGHHHLVFKAHPLEDGRVPLRREIGRIARAHGLAGRVHYVRGGKLARLLDHARSAVTVNSTAAQQALWRGLPLKVFGSAIYAKHAFVSDQPLPAFFAQPDRPDLGAYRDFRRYLLETSQVAGGFYSGHGRRQLLRQVVDMMLHPCDPYDALRDGTAAPRQRLSIVR